MSSEGSGLPRLQLLRIMETSRQGDRREGILLRQSKGWFAVGGMGQEGMAALAYTIRDDDILFPYYRDRALCLARGLTTYDLALAFFAASDSMTAGRQMPGHYGRWSLGIFSVATPTASQCLPAAGAAWAVKLEGSDRVVLCSVGDAALRQGEYYEAISFAIQEQLPLVFVIEDNGYGISTPTNRHNPYRLAIFNDANVLRVDGRDVQAVYAAGCEAVSRARRGQGPSVLWCEMDRLCSHTSSDDHRVYRDEAELQAMEARDPIRRLAAELMQEGILTDEQWAVMQAEIAREVEDAYAKAWQMPRPSAHDVERHVYADNADIPSLPEEVAGKLRAESPTTMVQAILETLNAALASDARVILFGEDIEDPKGGVFGLTRGLSTSYPGRVVNSPLAEATIVGLGVGLAACGWKPAFEIQFIDFMGPAFNQLVNQAATLRWRTAGDQACPLVLLAPAGAYLPGGGIWHSQTNEGLWTHVPGLRVCVPSTPADAASMLWAALHMGDPVLYLIPKHLFRKRMPFDTVEACEVGKCAIRRMGSDVTLVTWGNGTELAEECANLAEAEGVSVELLDLRWLDPCDWDGITASLEKTGRLVVLHEDSRTGGFGDTIVAEMTARPERWNLFLAPPQIVARENTPVPFAPVLEYAVLPDVERVMQAIREVMR